MDHEWEKSSGIEHGVRFHMGKWLEQRKEATEVALLAVVNIGGINWQPFGQRHITSILRALYGLMLHHLLTPYAHKAFHTRKLRQFSGSGKSF